MSTAHATDPRTATPRGRGRGTAAAKDNRDGLVMVAPTVVVVIAVVVIPALWNVLIAFQDLSYLQIRRAGLVEDLTLDNFVNVFTARGFWKSLWTTIVYSVGATAGSIALGLLAALAFRRAFPGRGALRAAMLLPYVAPVVAVAFVWQMLLDTQTGVVNVWGQRLLGWSESIDFLGTEPWALITVVVFEIWRYFPFAFMFLTARLLAVPRDMEEAALIDGCTPTQTFRHLILPQLASVIALLSVLRLVMTFNKFDDVYLLTGGTAGTEVAAVRVYDYLTGRFDAGGAAAMAVVLTLVLMVFLMIYLRFFTGKESDR